MSVMSDSASLLMSFFVKCAAVRTVPSVSLASVRNGGEGRGEEALRTLRAHASVKHPWPRPFPRSCLTGRGRLTRFLRPAPRLEVSRLLMFLPTVAFFLFLESSGALADSPTRAELPAVANYPVIGVKNIKRKLGEIVLPQVHFDGVPLSEVVKRLSEEAKRFDPEKRGVNFVIFDPPPVAGGNPAPVGPPLSLGDGLIHVREPLVGLTLRHALDVICKSAEVPTQFGVEDYAVSFFLRVPGGVFGRTIRANPDTFQQGLPGVVMSPVSGVSVGGSSPVGVGQRQGQGQGAVIGTGRAIIPAAAAAATGSAGEGSRLARQFVGAAGVTGVGVTGAGSPAVSSLGNGPGPMRGPMTGPRPTE